MKHPLRIALAAALVGVLAAFVPVGWRMVVPGAPAPPAQGAPWQVALPAPGRSEVFGLALPGATLADARARAGDELQVALIAGADGALALEAYLERFVAGGIEGRLLLSFDADTAALARWRERLGSVPTASGARRHALDAQAQAEAGSAPLAGIGFIPSAQLDAAMLQGRFGEPAERIGFGQRIEHWLYPATGMAVALDRDGRELLQYVAPSDFERRLAAPLRR